MHMLDRRMLLHGGSTAVGASALALTIPALAHASQTGKRAQPGFYRFKLGTIGTVVLRGGSIIFCLLPPTRLALGALSETEVLDASVLFNLIRNLGGAIGIALIDTVLYGRTNIHAGTLRLRLLAGDATTARAIGLDPTLFASGLSGSLTPNAEAYVRPMIENAAFVWSVNDAWAMLAAFALLGVLVVPLAWRTKQASATTIKTN